ncbi:hypothetical protein AB0F52_16895 [Amycolatopsis sp. NPDC024027]|uniref:hypothetical protein n=1 Tax=Amycolatopsis sp. NPDC024027 TaxID=3154327 RepID=UPI0033E26751
MSTGEGTEPGTGRTWPVRHGGGYPPGWQVRYRGRRSPTVSGTNGPRTGQERIGTIAGPTLRDEHTGTTWVAVRPFCAAPHTPRRLVRANDIIDAQPPDEPDPATAVDDE